MALSATVLAELIKAKSAAKQADPTAPEGWFIDVISEAIVEHITTQAQVVVASVSGVTTGPGVSGPGAGTIV